MAQTTHSEVYNLFSSNVSFQKLFDVLSVPAKRDAILDAKGEHDKTLLHCYSYMGKFDLILLLLAAKGRPEALTEIQNGIEMQAQELKKGIRFDKLSPVVKMSLKIKDLAEQTKLMLGLEKLPLSLQDDFPVANLPPELRARLDFDHLPAKLKAELEAKILADARNMYFKSIIQPGELEKFINSLDGNGTLMEYVNLANDTGDTAMHLAALNGKLEVARILHAAGADLFAQNKFGDMPISLARKGMANGVVGYLEREIGKMVVDTRKQFPGALLSRRALPAPVAKAQVVQNA